MSGTTAATSSTASTSISIFVDKNGRNEFVCKINRDLISKHSKTVRTKLEEDPAAEHFVITGADKGPVQHVVDFIKDGKRPIRIGVSQEPFAKAVAILQAVNAFDFDPPQPQIESHVVWKITQEKMTPWQVYVVQVAFGKLGTEGRIYKAMVQDVAYNVLHKVFTTEEVEKFKEVAKKFPSLDEAIRVKIEELKRRGEEHRKRVGAKEGGQAV